MAKIPEAVVEDVLAHTNITDVVSKYVNLKKSGNNLFGLCPFHEEKTPSFSVSEKKQIFHCFSCGRGGNVFKFLMDLQGISFDEAVQQVAKDDGVKLPSDISKEQQSPEHMEKQKLMQLHEEAAKLYHHVLVNTEIGEPALKYLHDRKVSDEMIETFNLGFAPKDRLLKPFFENKKTDYQLMRKSGLFLENGEGQLNDRFSGRVMFPINNVNGKTIGFSGRLLNKNTDAPKYLNSPETELFNKRKIIYNIDLAKPDIRRDGNLILFEGFMDVIAAYQAGVKNGVASMGTSLTNEQIYQFHQLAKQIYVCYDGDEPGQKAINRAVGLLEDDGKFNVGVIQMPNGVDPDEYRRQYGDEKFRSAIKSAKEPPIKFKLRFLKSQYDLSNEEDKLQYVDAAINVIAKADKPVERSFYLKGLADEFDLDLESLKIQTKQVRATLENSKRRHEVRELKSTTQSRVLEESSEPTSQLKEAENLLIYRMLNNSDVRIMIEQDPKFSFADDQYQTLYLLAQHFFETHDEYNPAEFSDFVKDPSLQSLLSSIDMTGLHNQWSEKEVADCVKIIKQALTTEVILKHKRQEMVEASQMGNIEKAAQIGKEMHDIQKEEQQ